MAYQDKDRQREFSRKWIAKKRQDPERHKVILEKRRAWRERNKEHIHRKEAEYRARAKLRNQKPVKVRVKLDPAVIRARDNEQRRAKRARERSQKQPVMRISLTKATIDAKVYAKKRKDETKDKVRHSKRQQKRQHMIDCAHGSGFTFEHIDTGGVRRKCKACGKVFTQIGR